MVSLPTLIVIVKLKDGDEPAYYNLEWGAKIEYDARGWVRLVDTMRGNPGIAIAHFLDIIDIRIVPPSGDKMPPISRDHAWLDSMHPRI